jgi:hypothetical protein
MERVEIFRLILCTFGKKIIYRNIPESVWPMNKDVLKYSMCHSTWYSNQPTYSWHYDFEEYDSFCTDHYSKCQKK